ncbi:Hypothetical protein RMHFA_04203 [Roseomonas mucosa]|nr:Hypothetical protein RMHFA_04203 [Roseomonas mucosa]
MDDGRAALRRPGGKALPFPRNPLSARTLRALDPMSWFSLRPDRAGEHRSPADRRCHRRGQHVFLFRCPASPPVPGDQPTV